jgi:glycosyltransferase involved in cell wall biosynthesis
LGASLLGARCGIVVSQTLSFRIGRPAVWKYRSHKVQRIVAVCQHVRDVVMECTGVPASRVVVVYGGTDTQRFDPHTARPLRVREELRIPAGARLVGHGGLSDWKGWKELLAAFPRVVASHPDAYLLLMGCASGRQCADTLEVVREVGLEGRVAVTGVRDDMADVLAACDVVVDASWAGVGISGTLREAMALAKPVVATRVGGHAELVDDGETGLLIPPRDVETLAAAVSRLLRDGELAHRLGRAARERVDSQFSTVRRMLQLEPLYRQTAWEAGLFGA